MVQLLQAFLKKFLTTAIATLMVVFCFGVGVIYGQGLETFDNSNATGNYGDGSFIGNDGIEWSYVHSRDEGAYPIDGDGLMLRRADEPSSLSATFTGGIGNFSVDTRKAFTGNAQRRLELVINGNVIDQFEPNYGDGADDTVFPFIVNDINISGTVELELRLYGSTGNQQMTLDNVEWTGFTTEDPTLVVSDLSLLGFSYQEGDGPSAAQSFELSGNNLDETTVTVTAPTNFELSGSEEGAYSSTLNFPDYDGTEETIWVRMQDGLVADTYSGDISITGGGADEVNISLSGEVTPPPITLTVGAYEQDFSDFVSFETLPVSWEVSDEDYSTTWGSGTASGLRGNSNVLGYQHTGSTGVFEVTLTLINDTGSTIEDLYVSYLGRVERLSATRFPEWTVEVEESEISELAYSTGAGQDEIRSAEASGLNIPNGETITIKWSSDRGFNDIGSSRQIGISNVAIGVSQNFDLTINTPEEWRLLATPGANATFGDLLSGSVFTQCFDGADSNEPPCGTEDFTSNVFTWSETDGVFQATGHIDEAVGAASGFAVYVFEDDDPTEEGVNGGFPKNLSFVAAEHGDRSLNLSFTDRSDASIDGWNLLGNPFAVTIYPSNFDLGSNADINDNVYIYDPDASVYVALDATDTATELASFTGFWVKTDATGQSFDIDQSAKTQQSSKQLSPSQFIVNMELGDRSSDLILRFEEGATTEFTNRDAYSLTPLNPVHAFINTEKSGRPIARGHFPTELDDHTLVLPLNITNTFSGTAALTAQNVNMPDGWDIELVNTESGERWNLLTESAELELTVEEQAKINSAISFNGPQLAQTVNESGSQFVLEVTSAEAVSIDEPGTGLPQRVALSQNYPNPFNPSTVISYDLPEASDVTIQVYDMTGRQVATLVNSRMEAGSHEVTFNAGNLASGVYIYRLQAGEHMLTRKLTLIK